MTVGPDGPSEFVEGWEMGRVLRRAAAAVAVIAVTMSGSSMAASAQDVSLAEETTTGVAWIYPIPLDAAAGSQDAWRRLQQPRARMNFPLSTTSRYEVRRASWRNWGGRRVKARGKVRLCWSSCTEWRTGVIVLAGRRSIACPAGEQQRYTRFRVRGFEGLSPAGVYRSRATC